MKKDLFFQAMAVQCLALTYDDVRLKTGPSEVMPKLVDIVSVFSRRVGLKCPIVSSPMDTVTESNMAIAMAMEGGLGIIHRNLTAEKQADEVARVKLHLNALIHNPIRVLDTDTIAQIEQMREQDRHQFHSFPVINKDDEVVGMVTRTDFDFCMDPKTPVSKIMSPLTLSAPPGTSLEEAFAIMSRNKKKVLPLVNNAMKLEGMYVISDIRRITTRSHDTYNTDGGHNLRVGAAISTGESEIVRAEMLVQAGVDVIVIDTAHGDSLPVFETLKVLKEKFPDTDIVVGNVSEGESAKRLVDAGADGIRVGQGGGSICTTRIIAGIGCPQVTAIYNCAKAIEGSSIPVCADGGIKNSGDITVAIGAGASCVMLGRLLAGTDESPGEIININGGTCKVYRGMGSLAAMKESAASRKRYGQSDTGKDLVPEGVEGVVPYQGPLNRILHQYVGGLRAGMGYVGASNIVELIKHADFHRISDAGLRESHPHDIQITHTPPNYTKGS